MVVFVEFQVKENGGQKDLKEDEKEDEINMENEKGDQDLDKRKHNDEIDADVADAEDDSRTGF